MHVWIEWFDLLVKSDYENNVKAVVKNHTTHPLLPLSTPLSQNKRCEEWETSFSRKGKQKGTSHKEKPPREEEGIEDKTWKCDLAKALLLRNDRECPRNKDKVTFTPAVLWRYVSRHSQTPKHDTTAQIKSWSLFFSHRFKEIAHGIWKGNTFKFQRWILMFLHSL